MKRILFIDRDGTLIIEPEDKQVDRLDKLEFYPGVISALKRIVTTGMYELVIVSNQDGLGTLSFPEDHFWPAQNMMMKTLRGEGIVFSKVLIDRSQPWENEPTRKPGTGLLQEFMTERYNLKGSYVIGDRISDIELSRNLGCQGILIGDDRMREHLVAQGLDSNCQLITADWDAVADLVLRENRVSHVERITRETDTDVVLHLDGSGRSTISTGLAFFDHMLDQLCRHAMVDLWVKVEGDLQVDEHHTIEDTALALGEAVAKALGSKLGIGRYGFCLPMDDALAQVALDFGGRPWLSWDVEFMREKIGDMPTEMFFHFFKSFSDAAKCTLHVRAEGKNEHHKIEAIFKALGKSIRMAVSHNGTNVLPSTKGVL